MNGEPTYNDESWKEEAPLLDSLEKPEKEFDTPEGYFDELPGKVMDLLKGAGDTSWEAKAPLLASLGREKEDSEVPEGYFESLPAKLMSRISGLKDEQDSEGEAASFLDGIEKPEMEDEAPEGYFEELPSRVLDRIRKDAPQNPKRSVFSRRVIFSIAASLALLLSLTWLFFRNPSPEEAGIYAQVEQLTEEEILNAIEMGELSDDEILEVMGDQALASLSFTQEISDQDLEPYLEDIDLNDLDLSDLDLDEKLLEEFVN